MGHSVGEYVAATIAGVFSLEDGLKLIAHRGKLMQALPQIGEMVAVLADEATVRDAIAPYPEKVAIAAINGSQSIVISGERKAIEQIVSELTSVGIKTKKLQVSHAFHSPLMEPMLVEFERVASEITYAPGGSGNRIYPARARIVSPRAISGTGYFTSWRTPD
jgi:acyl transferase domain-containing protein